MDSTFYFQWQYLITHINNLHYEKFQDGTVKCIEDEIPFEVPEGWCWCRLRDICMMLAGKSKPADQIKSNILREVILASGAMENQGICR